jgi:hypothetical protein
MMPSNAWHVAKAGIVLERDDDGTRELLWIDPRLPSVPDRASHPLRVEILCWFADLPKMNAGLRVVGDFFQRDSVLAAVSRRDDSTRFLFYTATWEAMVQERYLAVRAVLRPTAIGLRAAVEPSWESLTAIASTLGAPPTAVGLV